MWQDFKHRSVEVAIAVVTLSALMIEPAWATGPVTPMPGPAVGVVVAGAAIIGTLALTKWWRKK